MSVLNIRTLGAPGGEVLTAVAQEVTEKEFGEELEGYTSSMLETMYSYKGVGLSAPQLGDSRRIIVVDCGESSEDYASDSIRMINPVITHRGDDTVNSEEGCMSLPTMSAKVSRNATIKVQYQTTHGESKEEEFSGFMSVKIQHEIDHLDGITLLKYASRLKKSRYQKKIGKAVKRIMGRYNGG